MNSDELCLTLRGLIDAVEGPVFSVDAKYRYTSFNATHAEVMKSLYGEDIELGRSILEYQTVDEDRRLTRSHLDRVLLGERVVEEAFSGEEARTRHYFRVTHDPIRDDGVIIGAAVQAVDVTERRSAEESVRTGEERYRELVDHMTSGVIVYEPAASAEDFVILEFNAAAQRIEQRSRDEVVGRLVTDAFPGVEEFGLLDVLRRVARTGTSEYYPTTLYQDGRLSSWRENDVYRLPSGEVVAIYDDVTERIQAERSLAHAKDLLDLAEEIGHAGGWEYDVAGGRVTWTDEVYRIHGLEHDFDPNDVGRDVSFYAPGSAPLVAGAFRRAVESGEPYDLEVELERADGVRIWVRTIGRPLVEDGAVVSVAGNILDITELKQAEQSLLESIARQQAITDGVIAALSRTIEVRDPYTAGHERRVSELATAIARHMGLDEESVRGVQVAGMLHDVGKIVIPAEILAKPGRLSAFEFELIKEHPQAGFDVLKAIDFPWPLAEITLQHHERLDGSGYPAGLKGEAVLPEARIIAVADVVEAMISHRPYRPALPLDAAMAELEDGAGSRYDAAACEAAVSLFREQDFTLTE
jgi:PAS domain S-box-containing protein